MVQKVEIRKSDDELLRMKASKVAVKDNCIIVYEPNIFMGENQDQNVDAKIFSYSEIRSVTLGEINE